MKKFIVMAFALVISTFFVACSGKTELQFTNSANSFGNINEINWASDDTIWTQTGGWAVKDDTDSKEVTKTVGYVTCLVDNGGDGNYNKATVSFDGKGDSLSITSGSANKYTLEATFK